MSLFDPLPIAFFAGSLEGIRLFHPSEEPPSREWDAVHKKVQDALADLTSQVIEVVPGLRWKSGRSSGGIIGLFTYRVYYHIDGDDYDPIVVGVTLVESESEVQISGDISGDESGYIYYHDEGCERTVPADPASILIGAAEIAHRLSLQHDVVTRAIRERHSRATRR